MNMNKILPDINMLEPIVDSRETYCDSPMIKDFEKLSDFDRLQVLADIVRQTMIYEEYPNPITEIDSLIGDDYTSSKVFLTYLQSLNIYTDSYLALVTNRKNIDLEKYNGYHFVVIVRDINKNEYVVDTTPDIGYTYGEVNKLLSNSIYTDYLRIDEELDCFLKLIRYDMYNISNHHYDLKQIENYNLIKHLLDKTCFEGLLVKYFDCVNNSDYEQLKEIINDEYLDKINELKKMKRRNDVKKKDIVDSWKDNLDFLIRNTTDYKAQQKEAQKILGEYNLDKYVDIGGKKIFLNHITPRLFWELGYNVVIVKPSSFLAGVSSSVTEIMIPNRKNLICSYDCNLGLYSKIHLKPMSYFHPHGMKYEIQMNGPNRVLLVKEDADILNVRKHYVRENLTQRIASHYVLWFNGEKVLWDPDLNTNLVHSTDDATEASIHFLANYPEYQVFTRFNYPNPVLRKVKKDERRI